MTINTVNIKSYAGEKFRAFLQTAKIFINLSVKAKPRKFSLQSNHENFSHITFIVYGITTTQGYRKQMYGLHSLSWKKQLGI